jgi:predicted flap endonuclease-1-like 5' DNA nuclease
LAAQETAEVPTPQLPPQSLRQLTGITAAIERQLHRHGVCRFFDIAHWDRQDVERIAAILGIAPTRISQQRWVEQARRKG